MKNYGFHGVNESDGVSWGFWGKGNDYFEKSYWFVWFFVQSVVILQPLSRNRCQWKCDLICCVRTKMNK